MGLNPTGRFENAIAKFARFSLGQLTLGMIDRCFYIVEISTQWSLPIQEQIICDDEILEQEENVNSTEGRSEREKLIRPLTWPLFIILLIVIRLLRMTFNLGAFSFGYEGIGPREMIRYVQTYRKRLEEIQLMGLNNTEEKGSISNDDTKIGRWVMMGLFCGNHNGKRNNDRKDHSPSPERIRISRNDIEMSKKKCADNRDRYSRTNPEIDAPGAEGIQNKLNNAIENSQGVRTSPPDHSNFNSDEKPGNEVEINDDPSGENWEVEENQFQESDKKLPPLDNHLEKENFDKDNETKEIITGEDCVDYYSPVSSNSTSPDRWMSPIAESEEIIHGKDDHYHQIKNKDYENGEVDASEKLIRSESDITWEHASVNGTTPTIQHEKRSMNFGKSHSTKAKRTSHLNRRKK